jgi:hypothetical protein
MPIYEVRLVAVGIRLPIGGREAVGFFRLLRVSATDPAGAEAKAVALLHLEWQSTGHAKLNQGVSPMIRVETTSTLPWWYGFLPSRRGYVFFEKESEA